MGHSVRHVVGYPVRHVRFHWSMRIDTRTNARRSAAIAVGLGLAAVASGCAPPARTDADRRAEDVAIAMQIGPPLPDAIDTRAVWEPSSQISYSHVVDVGAIDEWYDALPDRFECDPVGPMAKDALAAGDVSWSIRCLVDEGDYSLVITAHTTVEGDIAFTTVGAQHEREDQQGITRTPARGRPPANVLRR